VNGQDGTSARALVGERRRWSPGASSRRALRRLVSWRASFARAALHRVPRAAWACALLACLNAICWSIVTPPFQTPDEPSHFAYVKQLAETGHRPTSSSDELSHEELLALQGLHALEIILRPQYHTIGSEAEQKTLESDLGPANATHDGSPAAGNATGEPPLYYALEAIPYELARSANLLDRLQLMRLLSTLFAGLTAMFTFLFVRETLPSIPWAWTVAGLAVALAPLLGFMSGSVNPDSMLFAVSAATFYLLARSFRRGFSARAAIAIGAVTAVGLSTKLNFVGLVPGVLLGFVVLSRRAARVSGRAAYRWLALAIAIASIPIAADAAIKALSRDPALGVLSTAAGSVRGSLLAELDYTWQLFLPRLPGTADYFPGLFPARQLWFDGYVGLYGWLDTPFPGWVDSLALLPAGAVLVLCARSLMGARAVVRRRAGELATYAAIAAGLMLLIGLDSYHAFPAIDAEYAQARYLLPLLPLLGVVLALAARGAGRRFGPAVGVLIVILFLAHDVFSQLQVVARFYG
jgi:4-amino-4-deoxy-L-arabinose transferase-like glycosyltransferase